MSDLWDHQKLIRCGYSVGYAQNARQMTDAFVVWFSDEMFAFLTQIHSFDVTHNDLKPNNIHVSCQQKKISLTEEQLKVFDFGHTGKGRTGGTGPHKGTKWFGKTPFWLTDISRTIENKRVDWFQAIICMCLWMIRGAGGDTRAIYELSAEDLIAMDAIATAWKHREMGWLCWLRTHDTTICQESNIRSRKD